MKTLRNLFALTALFCGFQSFAQTNGDLKVTVLDEKKQPIPGAIVRIVAGGPTTGGATNLDGNFYFRSIPAGNYDVEARYIGYKVYTKKNIIVNTSQTAYANFEMIVAVSDSDVVVIEADRSPVDKNFSTIQNIDPQLIKNVATQKGDVVGMVTGFNSQVSEGKGGQLVMRGSREGASKIFVDGEALYGTLNVTGMAIDRVSILSGGIPASYGDVSGGIIIISTKSFYTGQTQKQTMYEAAAEKAEAEKKAKEAEEGKRIENKEEVIEDGAKEAPAPQQQPASTDGDGN
ncbi:MAG: carboxypeptidase regulatory-like domain-containing protein [Bacteroidia bacterium]